MGLIAKSAIGLAAVTLLGVGLVVALEERAASRAKSFCDRFKPGTAFAEARRAAAQEIDAQYRKVLEGEVSASFYGGTPMSLHICTIEAVEGRVSEALYSHAD